MSEDVKEVRKQIVVAMLTEDEDLRKFVKAFLEVYSETGEALVSR
jgi:hypothetical protein